LISASWVSRIIRVSHLTGPSPQGLFMKLRLLLAWRFCNICMFLKQEVVPIDQIMICTWIDTMSLWPYAISQSSHGTCPGSKEVTRPHCRRALVSEDIVVTL
jgi:hypothetical protein